MKRNGSSSDPLLSVETASNAGIKSTSASSQF